MSHVVSNDLRLKMTKLDLKTCARMGYLKLGQTELQTPILWLGHKFGSPPKPWEFLDIGTVVVNAYELLSDKNRLEMVENQGINSYLGFGGLVMIDSGGFLFMRRSNLSIDKNRLLQLYDRSKPMIGVILDCPLDPFASETDNAGRWARTVENTRIMLGHNGSVPLMPVIHGYTLSDIERACDDVEKLCEVNIVGIGSLVPLMKGVNGKGNGPDASKQSHLQRELSSTPGYSSRYFVVDAIKYVRKRFPDALLHVFGVGGTTTMHLMLALGVDSLDTIGWRLKAGHGAIQLPGVGDRFLKPRHNRKTIRHRRVLDEKEKDILSACKCPICADLSLPERIEALDKSYEKRAIHNAWTYLEELRQFKQSLQHKSLYQFVDSRMRRGALRQLCPLVLRDIKESPPAKAIRGPNHAQE